jgi:simple sugar transport system ATP-binding protein
VLHMSKGRVVNQFMPADCSLADIEAAVYA